MHDVELAGTALAPGSVISFRVDPPVPYQMRIQVTVLESQEPRFITGRVEGDLHGRASLALEPEGAGTRATIAWDVEIANRGIRRVIRIARPLLIWAQHWAVGIALHRFRSYLAEEPEPPG